MSVSQDVDGISQERRFIVARPQILEPNKRYPILFVFHGNGGTGSDYVDQFSYHVESAGLVAVYPDGVANSWNLGPEASNADDVEFVKLIVNELAQYSELDTSRMFAYGESNGAGMAHLLGIETNLFNGIGGTVTALLEKNKPAAGTKSSGVLQIMGTVDSIVPYTGGVGVLGHNFMGAEASAKTWAAANSCDNAGSRTTTAGGNIRIEYTGCAGGVSVLHYGIVGAGHGIPGEIEGGLTDLILDFFFALPNQG